MRNQLWQIAWFRFRLLLRQKLGWGVLGGASLFFPFALFLAMSSYVRPDKIYWDLSSGFCFLVATLLVSYLGTHLFHEEQNKKTLSFVLTQGTSRNKWILGNIIGIGILCAFAIFCWTLVTVLGAYSVTSGAPPFVLFQSQYFLFLEMMILLSTAFLFSLFLRPLLSWFLLLSLIALLHSRSYLEILVVESGFSGLSKGLYDAILFTMNFLPPLEWWDIRMFVGFEESISFTQTGSMTLLSLAWIFICLFLARLKMEVMDL